MGNWLFPSGCVVAVILWIAFWLIFHSADRGFVLALISVIGVPICKYEYQKMHLLESWDQLLQAVAELEHFGKNIYLPKVLEENEKTRKESLKLAEDRHSREAEVLRKSLVAKAKQIEAELPVIDTQYQKLMVTGGFKVEDYKSAGWQNWQPAQHHVGWFRIGELALNTTQLPATMTFLYTAVTVPRSFYLPALASIANGQSMVLRATDSQQARVANLALKNFVFRVLANTPPGRVLFTFIDPIGQGNNATAFLELADFHESLVNTKAWADSRQIENKLSEITLHMEEVIQKRLRDHATIEDYNQHNRQIAEAYRVVVIFDFPDSFSETSARQLLRIVQNGARCGVYALIVSNESRTGLWCRRWHPLSAHSCDLRAQRRVCMERTLSGGEMVTIRRIFSSRNSRPEIGHRLPEGSGEPSDYGGRRGFEGGVQGRNCFSDAIGAGEICTGQAMEGDASQGLRVPIGLGSNGKPWFLDLGNGKLSFHVLLI